MKFRKAYVVGIILIVIIGMIGVTFVSSEGNIEENSFGYWKTNIEVTYIDGYTEQLSMSSLSLGSIFSGDEEIIKVTYRLQAKAEGEGYDGCEIDFTSFSITPIVEDKEIPLWTGQPKAGNIETIIINDDYVDVLVYELGMTEVEQGCPNGIQDGRLIFRHEGTIQFRGTPDGLWAEVNNPSNPYIDIYTYEDTTPPDPTTYTVTIKTNPTNCYVEFAGVQYDSGSTGSVSIENVEEGEYYVVVAKDGYYRQQGYKFVNGDETFSYTLESTSPPTYTVTIKTNPTHCTVELDAGTVRIKNSGSSGKAVFDDVLAGTHYITVSKSGYIRKQGYRTVNGDVTFSYTLSPSSPPPPPTYTVTVKTNPTNCNVEFEGHGTKNSGSSGKAVFTGVEAGSYYITVSKSGYIRQQGYRTVNGDKTFSYTLEPSGPPTYTVTIKTNPTHCTVELDAGTVRIKNSGSSGKAVFDDVLAGTHYITVSKSGYIRKQGYRTVNGDVTFSYTLSPTGQIVPLTFIRIRELSFGIIKNEASFGRYYTSPNQYLGRSGWP